MPGKTLTKKHFDDRAVFTLPFVRYYLIFTIISFFTITNVQATEILRKIKEIKSLTVEQANLALPCELEAVVIYLVKENGTITDLIVHDGETGIFCGKLNNKPREINVGSLVKLKGSTFKGGFIPTVNVSEIEKLGEAVIPTHKNVNYEQLSSGRYDCDLISIKGIVRSVTLVSNVIPHSTAVVISCDSQRLGVRMPAAFFPIMHSLIDHQVEAHGVGACFFNSARQIISPMMWIANSQDVKTLHAPDILPPLIPASNLFIYDYKTDWNHRLRVIGTVTAHHGKSRFYLSDQNMGLAVDTIEEKRPPIGSTVEVTGFARQSHFGALLEDATLKIINSIGKIDPPTIAPASAGVYESALVRLKGTVTNIIENERAAQFFLSASNMSIIGRLPKENHFHMPQVRVGAEVELTGVVQVERPNEDAFLKGCVIERFELLMRTPSDLKIIHPGPWWTLNKFTAILGSLLGFGVIMFATRWRRARRRFYEQTLARRDAEGRFSAVLAERNRMARDIHDTLAQGLTAISTRIEAAKDALSMSSSLEKVHTHLIRAKEIVTITLDEARRSVWEMRSQALENKNLTQAIGSIVEQLNEGSNTPQIAIMMVGTARRTVPATENALLRLAQESLTNAIRYAAANRITITCYFEASRLGIKVEDDGCGFITDDKKAGFGISGMRERIESLGGHLLMTSELSHGTKIQAWLPG
jgi:signal transduction histidine kinase